MDSERVAEQAPGETAARTRLLKSKAERTYAAIGLGELYIWIAQQERARLRDPWFLAWRR